MPAALVVVAALVFTLPAWADDWQIASELPPAPAAPLLELEDDFGVQEPRNDENGRNDELDGYTREAMRLRRIHEILPYFDYEPDPEVARTDPCRNLCPRPPGCPPSPDDPPPMCPEEAFWPAEVYVGRAFGPSLFPWEASNLFHRPLYFEDVALERYGHSYHMLQPFVSVGRFSTQLVGLPYQMTIDPCWERKYVLGYHRPGDCVPKLHYLPPWDWHAALVQAGVVTGLVLILP